MSLTTLSASPSFCGELTCTHSCSRTFSHCSQGIFPRLPFISCHLPSFAFPTCSLFPQVAQVTLRQPWCPPPLMPIPTPPPHHTQPTGGCRGRTGWTSITYQHPGSTSAVNHHSRQCQLAMFNTCILHQTVRNCFVFTFTRSSAKIRALLPHKTLYKHQNWRTASNKEYKPRF